MPLVTSTPPVSRTESAPSTRAQIARVTFNNSPWRPLVCCAGALGIGLSLTPLWLRPQNAPTNGGDQITSQIVLPSESTLVVTPTFPPGLLLRGQIQLVADVTGKAPVGGQVARHLVENGARVKRGDAVLEISSGNSVRTFLPAESRQNRAEQGQIAAANAQTALAQKIAAANSQLLDAQSRVTRSQAQVGAARDVVRRLQNGETVAPNEIPAPFRGPDVKTNSRAANSRRRSARRSAASSEGESKNRVSGANRIALRQAQTTREAAQSSARDLQSAQKMLADAQINARQADEKLQSATQNVTDVEARFSAKKASGADVEAARAAQKEAQQIVNSADRALLAGKSELNKREKIAASTQSSADSAAAQAAKALSAARLDLPSQSESRSSNDAESQSTENAEISQPAPTRVTLDQAIRFASAALDESRRASRAAERLHAQIEAYQSQVTNSQSRIEAATQDLVTAQQRVLDSTPRPRFSTSYAPADGVVMWISRLAREVGAGQAVFGLARGEKIAARFEDKSGLWRSIKKDALLPALVVEGEAVGISKTPLSSPTGSDSSLTTSDARNVSAPESGRAVEVKITAIETPAEAGAAATLTAEVQMAPGAGAPLREGAAVLVSMPKPNQKATLSVPASALVQRGDATYLAVLSPIVKAAKETLAATKNEAAQTQQFQLDWQRVETGRSDGLRLEITAGLKAGARVVALPEQLEAMGFAPQSELNPSGERGAASTLSDNSAATPDAPEVSEALMPTEVLVRLAPALT